MWQFRNCYLLFSTWPVASFQAGHDVNQHVTRYSTAKHCYHPFDTTSLAQPQQTPHNPQYRRRQSSEQRPVSSSHRLDSSGLEAPSHFAMNCNAPFGNKQL